MIQNFNKLTYLHAIREECITLHRDSTTQVKTVCERELSEFILVAPTLLFDNPCTMKGGF